MLCVVILWPEQQIDHVRFMPPGGEVHGTGVCVKWEKEEVEQTVCDEDSRKGVDHLPIMLHYSGDLLLYRVHVMHVCTATMGGYK